MFLFIAIIARLHYLVQSYETFLFRPKCISSLITVSPIIDGCLSYPNISCTHT
ncbi:hypothetical protein NEIELOOT_02038 [Neisseria elongata subsp. glycolytica ATCC 29315]|uniref:Uncharacterized protein n=1 Tax=Neisseria elongata subsp. glycolytica ATCC 29315 TaxID=546263 RepID=D4DSJ3_NEIEG|nr:hypothetical protein NEIELOOT_02038 [Neisseria elongata subsp. glycolytica ATCC 29315]